MLVIFFFVFIDAGHQSKFYAAMQYNFIYRDIIYIMFLL